MNKSRSIPFIKIHGNGNDFIYFYGEDISETLSKDQIQFLTDRHKGIGADGVLIQMPHKKYDFQMIYFNSDGNRVEFCGNGARCISYLASKSLKKKNLHFVADDGPHEASVFRGKTVALKMRKPEEIAVKNLTSLLNDLNISYVDYFLINTGVPHCVIELKDIDKETFFKIDIIEWSRAIRYNSLFPDGININFTIQDKGRYVQRTYERGVEDETLSCGTGSVAVALYWKKKRLHKKQLMEIKTIGGLNKVDLREEVPVLIGKVYPVFKGRIKL